ncbi:putative Phasin family protein [uncultured Gammaproteobacteria bacterium]
MASLPQFTAQFEDAAGLGRRLLAEMVQRRQREWGQQGGKVIRNLDRLIEEGQRSVEAMVVSGEIVARGLEEAGASVSGYVQGAIRQGMATAGALVCARSPQEAIELQRGYLQAWTQAFFHQGAQLSDVTARTANEVVLPFNEYVEDVRERLAG